MDTASPPVSPRVVAAILMIQKTSVTSGTFAELIVGSPVIEPRSGCIGGQIVAGGAPRRTPSDDTGACPARCLGARPARCLRVSLVPWLHETAHAVESRRGGLEGRVRGLDDCG